ncbi:hypothetical protein PsorP6_012674 [Peronosclerospora sorghi]|uniref:Uncharacterized protein n=1 Tax=Peronosclerospora sorghi TaxID=230839 RepID=A0ACC0WFD9_9STRA|nr:hypothetical protein PsorP6_012674 [Peronosclerospora sorghi]
MATCSRCLIIRNSSSGSSSTNSQKYAEKIPEDETDDTLVKTSFDSPFSRVKLQRYGEQMLVEEFRESPSPT